MLGFTKRAVPASDMGMGLFGKVASVADFVSAGDYSPASGHLSRWLEEGVGWAAAQGKVDWSAIEASEPRAFIFGPEHETAADRVVVGLVRPSRDTVGRHFPLAIYSELALGSDLSNYSVIPLAAGDFLERAQSMLVAAQSGRDPRDQLRGASSGIAPRLSSARDEFDGWAGDTPMAVVWSALFGDEGVSRARATLSHLLEILAPFRGKDGASTMLTLRLPLGAAGVAGVVFWLEVIRRHLGWKRRVPCAFWHTYVDTGMLVVPLGDPLPRTLAGLWLSDDRNDSLCDLTISLPLLGQLPAAIDEALGDSASASKFLSVL
jgi:type VI secretion system protein ImpM